MTIGIVFHPYGEAKPGGLARTIFEWTSALLSNDAGNQYIIFLKNNLNNAPKLPGHPKIVPLGGGKLWLDKLKEFPELDLCIFQTPVLPPIYKPKRSIIIVQDFPYKHLKAQSLKERLRNNFLFRYHKRSLGRADAVIAVSEATKNDLIKFFKVPPEKITVIYMGYKNICAEPEAYLDLPEKFFFYAGVIKERKNVLNIVKAFAIFTHSTALRIGSDEPKKNLDYKLVLAGKDDGDYAQTVKEFVRASDLNAEVIFLGYLNDYQLSRVYKKAAAFIFPSLVEGFGFPVLEAMACGLPVITANFGGPAEIGANGAAILVDPLSPERLAEAMTRIVTDPNYRHQLIAAGLARSQEFSWNKTAEKTLELIKNI